MEDGPEKEDLQRRATSALQLLLTTKVFEHKISQLVLDIAWERIDPQGVYTRMHDAYDTLTVDMDRDMDRVCWTLFGKDGTIQEYASFKAMLERKRRKARRDRRDQDPGP